MCQRAVTAAQYPMTCVFLFCSPLLWGHVVGIIALCGLTTPQFLTVLNDGLKMLIIIMLVNIFLVLTTCLNSVNLFPQSSQ